MISGDIDSLKIMLRRRAMDLLARREHTRYELSQKLSSGLARNQPSVTTDPAEIGAMITEVLDKLEQDNLLSESRFTESFINGRVNRGYGPLYIRHQLSRRQVDPLLTVDYLQDSDQEVWAERLAELIKRRAGGGGMPERGSKPYFKLQRFALSRGFTLAQWWEAEERLKSL